MMEIVFIDSLEAFPSCISNLEVYCYGISSVKFSFFTYFSPKKAGSTIFAISLCLYPSLEISNGSRKVIFIFSLLSVKFVMVVLK